ncbi:hypothetical protein MC885_000339 [Smutsia gigantea]|nr:hypothetical protein MC885_000339 [Smutsia gigantea]
MWHPCRQVTCQGNPLPWDSPSVPATGSKGSQQGRMVFLSAYLTGSITACTLPGDPGDGTLCHHANGTLEPFSVSLNSGTSRASCSGHRSQSPVPVLSSAVVSALLSQAPEAHASSTPSARPTQEEQSTSPPGKVAAISSRSPRCPRSQSTLRGSKAFPPSAAPCSSGESQSACAPQLAVLGLAGHWRLRQR